MDDVVAAFVAAVAIAVAGAAAVAALPGNSLERVRGRTVARGAAAAACRLAVFVAGGGGFDVVPWGHVGGDGCDDAGRSGPFDRGDEGGGGAEDVVELGVDVGFDVDRVRGRGRVDEGDEDAEGGAKHGASGFLKFRGHRAGVLEGFLALFGEGDDFG